MKSALKQEIEEICLSKKNISASKLALKYKVSYTEVCKTLEMMEKFVQRDCEKINAWISVPFKEHVQSSPTEKTIQKATDWFQRISHHSQHSGKTWIELMIRNRIGLLSWKGLSMEDYEDLKSEAYMSLLEVTHRMEFTNPDLYNDEEKWSHWVGKSLKGLIHRNAWREVFRKFEEKNFSSFNLREGTEIDNFQYGDVNERHY